MIKKINAIKKIGVFDDFHWVDLPDLTVKNILYGWNYSGKTTLSRVFACMENKSLNSYYPEGEFNLELTNDEVHSNYTHSNISECAIIVRVFNEDFKEKNISWNGQEFNPILLLGEESIETQAKIDELKAKLLATLERKEECAKEETTTEKDYESKLSQKATSIKETLRLGTFTKIHFKPIVNGMEDDFESYKIDDDKIDEQIAISTSTDKLDPIEELAFTSSYSNLYDRTKIALEKVPSASSIIKKFEENEDLSDWVSTGIKLHSPNEECNFCGNNYTQERNDELQKHFSEEYNALISEIKGIREAVIAAKIEFIKPDKTRFYKSLGEKFETTSADLETEITNYNTRLVNLDEILKIKETSVFDKLDIHSNEDNLETLTNKLENYVTVIKEHNKLTEEFEEGKSKATESLKKHYASLFIVDNDYFSLKKKERVYGLLKERYARWVDTIKTEISTLEASISTAHKGKDDLNKYIKAFLGDDHIKIEVVLNEDANERFVIKRGGNDANNLSEGEKSAIAFSYFLIKLKEHPIEETIVYIDDPISSLDSNHIYHIYHLINNCFFYFDDTEGDSGANKTLCKQIFISTHNFELLTLLKKLPSNRQFIKTTNLQVIRKDKDNSTIVPMNRLFLDFESEYNYLFTLIKEQAGMNAADGENQVQFLLLPNAVRKFLETYTLSKIPVNVGVEKRAVKLFGEEATEIVKFLHHHSHQENVDGLGYHDGSIFNLNTVCKEIITWLQTKDLMHYEALTGSISIS